MYREPHWQRGHSRWDWAAPGPSPACWGKQGPHHSVPANGASSLLAVYSIQQKARRVSQALAYCLTLTSLTLSSLTLSSCYIPN